MNFSLQVNTVFLSVVISLVLEWCCCDDSVRTLL